MKHESSFTIRSYAVTNAVTLGHLKCTKKNGEETWREKKKQKTKNNKKNKTNDQSAVILTRLSFSI